MTDSGKSSGRWLDRLVFARIDASAPGWTTEPETLTALLALSWTSLALHRSGLTAITAEADADTITTELGALVRRLPQLETVEIRADVVALVVTGGVTDAASVDIANVVRSSNIEPVAILSDAQSTTWVFDAWRKADLESALTP